MATNTTNLELKKPAYSDTADISDINGNMDIIDTAVNAVENGMAIIANGNTHDAITSGQYVYIRKHGSLSEGLYKATQTIATNGTLSSSNVTAVSGGALNTLFEQIGTVNSKIIETDYITISGETGINSGASVNVSFPYTNNNGYKSGVIEDTSGIPVGLIPTRIALTSASIIVAYYNVAQTRLTIPDSGKLKFLLMK